MGAKKWKGKEKYSNLFSPIRMRNVRAKNRIIAAPTSPSMITTEGHFTPEMIAYLEEKALGGAGIVTYGEAIVHSATGKSSICPSGQITMKRSGISFLLCRNAGLHFLPLGHG